MIVESVLFLIDGIVYAAFVEIVAETFWLIVSTVFVN